LVVRLSWAASFTGASFFGGQLHRRPASSAASFIGGQRPEPDQGPVLGHPDRAR
jgi:hypothetical protein